ncbi:MAG: O-methyltransferase [Patescibacteria group bacterium]
MNSVHKFISITKDLASYINKLLDRGESKNMKMIREDTEAFEHGEMQAPISQLRVIVSIMQMIGARRILEVGTFRGMTAARLAQAFPADIIGAKVVTIERDIRFVEELKKRWADLGVMEKIDLRSGQAADILDRLADEISLEGYFDLAFIDADKEQYKNYTEKVLQLIRPGGVILVDNTLWRGEVAGTDTQSNLTKYVQDFNEWVFEKFGENASIIPAWDGMTIIVKE